MLVLILRSDKPEAEIGLYLDGEQLSYETWPAHRELAETIHTKIRDMLAASDRTIHDIEGLVVYKGPGSFTGLRIGLSVANTLAYSLDIPIAGTSGDEWINSGLSQLSSQPSKSSIMPDYGAPVHITAPRR